MIDQISFILNGGHVKRFHTVDTIRTQNNAEHSWGVASLVQLIDPSCSKELLLYALWHDVPESVTGDIPSTTKWRYPSLKNILTKIEEDVEKQHGIMPKITEEEYHVLKVADSIETILFCRREQSLGNQGVQIIMDRCAEKVLELSEKMNNKNVIKLLIKAQKGELR